MQTNAIIRYDKEYIKPQVICGTCGYPAPEDIRKLTLRVLERENSSLLPFPVPYNCEQCDKYELLAKIGKVDFQLDAVFLAEQRKYDYSIRQKFVELFSSSRFLK